VTKVGLFGGSFDPPHLGHLIVAQEVLSILNLNRILFIPAHLPPHKHSDTPSSQRYEMTGIAVAGNPRFEISDMELKRGGTSYTVDTLKELHCLFREVEFYLLIGTDEFAEIGSWKDPEAVMNLSKVVVMTRPGHELGGAGRKFKDKFLTAEVPLIEISSTQIREKVKRKESIAYLVPPGVEAYIKEKGLYR
jgi:nicotinate-nucleotide adenylyltransferase